MRDVPGFDAAILDLEGSQRCVYCAGSGPAVIVMSEIPGITPQVAGFAQRIVEAGYTVFMPLLFGEPMRRRFRQSAGTSQRGQAQPVVRMSERVKHGERADKDSAASTCVGRSRHRRVLGVRCSVDIHVASLTKPPALAP